MQEFEGFQLDAKTQRDIAYLSRVIEDAKRQAQVAIIEARAREIEDLAQAVVSINPFEIVPFLVAYIERRRTEIKAMVEQVVAEDQQRAAAQASQVSS